MCMLMLGVVPGPLLAHISDEMCILIMAFIGGGLDYFININTVVITTDHLFVCFVSTQALLIQLAL